MAIVSKKKEKPKAQDTIVAYQCYACNRFDGTFGPESGQHEHVCEICKKLPSHDEDDGPIEHHLEQFYAAEARGETQGLPCDRCGRERDVCVCPDNPFLEALGMDPELEQEMLEAEERIELEDEEQPLNPFVRRAEQPVLNPQQQHRFQDALREIAQRPRDR